MNVHVMDKTDRHFTAAASPGQLSDIGVAGAKLATEALWGSA